RRAHPRLAQLLVLDGRGRLRFPPPEGPISDEERRFVDAHHDLLERGALAHPARDEATGRSAPHGWQPAPGGDGLFFWRRRPDGGFAAVLVPSVTLLETLVARLPATAPRAAARYGAIPTDAAGERIALEEPEG